MPEPGRACDTPSELMNHATPQSRPTAEALALQAEWRNEPASLTREEAGRALEALSQAAAEPFSSSTTEPLPAVPDDLRAQWQTLCAATTAPSRSPAPPDTAWTRFWQWVRQPRGLAFAAGGCAAVFAALFFLSQSLDPLTGPGPDGATPPVLRGNDTAVAEDDDTPAPVWLVAPASLTEQAATAHSELARAFPGRAVTQVDSSDAAMAEVELHPRLIIIDLTTRTVTAWRGGELAGTFALGQDTSVITRLEDADEKLASPPLVPR